MGYSTGMMRHRIVVAKKGTDSNGKFGKNSSGVQYVRLGEFWAAADFVRGVKPMREAAADAYDTMLFRMRWNGQIDRDCLIIYDGRCFEIESLQRDYMENILQIKAVEMSGTLPTDILPN